MALVRIDGDDLVVKIEGLDKLCRAGRRPPRDRRAGRERLALKRKPMLSHLAAAVMSLAAVTATPAEATPHLVPAHRAGQRLRAALLLPGSGPTDRDGNQPPASAPSTLARRAGRGRRP